MGFLEVLNTISEGLQRNASKMEEECKETRQEIVKLKSKSSAELEGIANSFFETSARKRAAKMILEHRNR